MRHFMLLILCVGALLVGWANTMQAQDPPRCPDGFPESPIITQHLEQDQIVNGELSFEAIFDAGETLFTAKFNICDGQGRPATTGTGNARSPHSQPQFVRTSGPDANSCAGCHNDPRAGGGGDFVVDVFVLAQAADPVLMSIEPETSNERNTLGMFGAGPIEMLAREMTADLHAIRDSALDSAMSLQVPVSMELVTKGVSFGVLTAMPDGELDMREVHGIDNDLIVRPFHQSGVVVSLREFTVNAMNHHHGMQAEERFDLIPDKGPDYDQDGVERELTIGDITAVSIWQAALGVPGRVLPSDPELLASVERGEQLFVQVECGTCHIPELRLDSRFFVEPNPYNPTGTFADTEQSYRFDMTEQGEGPFLERDGDGAIVRAYTDLKRHNLCDPEWRADAIRYYCNEYLRQNRPDQHGRPGTEFFLTRKLWDVGNSAPYGHRGDLTTITEAIVVHGGEARASRDAFVALSPQEQRDIINFLKTLQVLPKGAAVVMVEGEVGR